MKTYFKDIRFDTYFNKENVYYTDNEDNLYEIIRDGMLGLKINKNNKSLGHIIAGYIEGDKAFITNFPNKQEHELKRLVYSDKKLQNLLHIRNNTK